LGSVGRASLFFYTEKALWLNSKVLILKEVTGTFLLRYLRKTLFENLNHRKIHKAFFSKELGLFIR
jgi:hypothetical protein